MSIAVLAVGFAIALFTSLLFTPLVARLARRKKWVDVPGGERTVHQRPTPRAGGLAIILASLVGSGYLLFFGSQASAQLETTLYVPSFALLIGGLVVAVMGLYDDAYGLGFKKKFLIQLVVAYVMYLVGYRVNAPVSLGLDTDPYLQAALGLPLTLLWYLGAMNAINLIDGLDGLATGVSLMAFGGLALIFGLNGDLGMIPFALVIAGALVGFLFYNFNPASIFLGDTGSLFLGFILATFALEGQSHSDPLLALFVMALVIGYPILDTSLAFLRRFLAGKSPFAPDKDHIHHRLMRRPGMSTRRTVVLLYGLHGLLAFAAIVLVGAQPGYAIVTVFAVAAGLIIFLKRLGYLKFQESIRQLQHRLATPFEKREPRGNWKPDRPAQPAYEPIISQKQTLKLEKEDERALVAESVE